MDQVVDIVTHALGLANTDLLLIHLINQWMSKTRRGKGTEHDERMVTSR